MEARHPSPSEAPDLLGAFGKLREALAALRNLEHLLGSVQVGPKILAHVMPELEHSSQSWLTDSATLLGHCKQVLACGPALDEFERRLASTLTDISSTLAKADPLAARSRLALERDVRRFIPSLATYVDYLELLLEATVARGVPLSLAELLHSRPELMSEGPSIGVRLAGDAERLEVTLPARVLLRALGTLAASEVRAPGLVISADAGRCRILVRSDVESSVLTQLPTLAPLAAGTAVLRCALLHTGVELSADNRQLELPCRPIH
ncbi:MAG TPA: hypothetical protein VLC09_06170 [Polyangiaceae bacterium]|nr:hypothetical protein [Polyangiaceae bacterium]